MAIKAFLTVVLLGLSKKKYGPVASNIHLVDLKKTAQRTFNSSFLQIFYVNGLETLVFSVIYCQCFTVFLRFIITEEVLVNNVKRSVIALKSIKVMIFF